MFDLGRYREGAVKVRISGGWIERFINRCLAAGFCLWDIKTDGRFTTLWMKLDDFKRVREIAADSRVQVQVIARRGCPFFVRKLFKRKGLIVGPILFAVLIYLFTLFVWQVEVVGNHTVDADEILALARENGIYVGAFRSSVEPRDAEKAILANCGRLVWCGVRQEGTRIVVEVVEKTPRRAEGDCVGDIVARTDGVLTELIVLAGTAAKASGDTVKKGDVLIRGVEPRYGIETGDIDADALRTIGAKGIARARVWYEGYGEAPLETMKGERTDRAIYAVSVRAGEYTFDWQSADMVENAIYETEKKMVKWRNQIFPVEIITHIYYECESIGVPISKEEATCLAKKRAWQSITEQIPKDAEVKTRRDDIVSESSAGVVRVRAIAETVEEIGIGPSSAKSETEE